MSYLIHALRELLSVKVEMHENPAPAFSAVERILRDYFPDSGMDGSGERGFKLSRARRVPR